MFKLLNASFSRMKQNKILLGIIIITIGIALFFISNSLSFKGIDLSNDGLTVTDKAFLNYINIIGIFIAIFTSLFIGTEYDYGTIRNKIIVGHSRISIYLSNLICSILVGIFLELIYSFVILVLGIPILGKLHFSLSEFIIIFSGMILIIITYSSIFSLISLLSSNVTMSTTICMLLFLAMYVICSSLSYTINIPEYITNSYYDDNLIKHITKSEPNPEYPSKLKMNVCKSIYYSIPSGQAIEISSKAEKTNWTDLTLYALGISSIINIIGIYFFRKKELK